MTRPGKVEIRKLPNPGKKAESPSPDPDRVPPLARTYNSGPGSQRVLPVLTAAEVVEW